MKSSKYTQASSPNDNEYRDYQNIGITRLPDDGNKNIGPSYIDAHCHNVNNSSELLLKNNYEVFKTAESRNEINRENIALNNRSNQATENIELMCNCAIKEVVFPLKNKFKDFNSEQNVVLNRSFTSIPKLASTNLSQYSLDRRAGGGGKGPHPHRQQKHHVQTLQRNPSLKRVRSPEIINIHRAAVGQCPTSTVIYDDYAAAESYGAKVCPYDQEFKCDDYGFTRGPSFQSSTLRSTTSHGPHPMGQLPKRRAAGDGMDAEMDDPEIMLELSGHQMRADCHCPCSDHVLYSPNYTTCIHQDERMVPATAPDVTRRLGPVTPLGKVVADAQASPPYYRANSATSSSSNSSTSRIELSTRHWWIILIVLLFAAAAGVGVPIALKISSSASFDERLEFATRLLQEVPLIDGHNDLPWNIRKFLHNKLKDFNFNQNLKSVKPWSGSSWSHTDLVRLQQGHVAAQFWAAYVPCDSQYKDAVQLTLEQIDVIRRLTDMYHPPLTLCTSSQDILAAHKKHQLCSLIGVEGGHSLAGSLAVLRTLYHVGVRYLTLTSTCNTPWADCSFADLPGKKPEHGGLTDFGKTIIKEMNRLGMIVDLSHVSVRTMRDALDVSKAPVIFSHSSAHALCNSTRNVPDDTLRKLALNRGVVMVNFYSQFLTCKDVSGVQDAVAHINHIREVAGVDNVGLGAGYDGINFVPEGLKDVSSYPNLFAELIATGKWGVEDLKKLAGLNFLRVFEEVEKIRDEFKKANITPYEDVLVPKPGRESNCTSLPAV